MTIQKFSFLTIFKIFETMESMQKGFPIHKILPLSTKILSRIIFRNIFGNEGSQ